MLHLHRRIWTHFDFVQILFIVPIIVLSYVLIADVNENLANKQLVYFFIGFAVFLLFFIFPIRKMEWLIPLVYWVNIALLVGVEFFGTSRLGAQRWIEIPFVNFTIQPSEIMKPSLILMLAYLIKKDPPNYGGYGFKKFLKLSAYIILPFVLIMIEPDLGTALVLLFMGFGTLFIIGVNHKIWVRLIIFLIIILPIFYANLHDYQKRRIEDFINKEPSYQVRQSIIAIGNGGIFGNSKEEATQTQFRFLPIATSDFIFAYTVERRGFVSGAGLILLYGFLIAHLLSLNYKLRHDYFAKTFINAVAILIFVYVSVNISMTIGFAPVVGIPLPFFSYGGSSFITFMALFGIIQNLLTFQFDTSYSFIKIK